MCIGVEDGEAFSQRWEHKGLELAGKMLFSEPQSRESLCMVTALERGR